MTDTRLLTQPHPTVEPAVVHRRHADTAFLADVHPDGTGGYAATALLPERHAYYAAHVAEANRRLDPMLLLEACRQLVIYIGHDGLGLADDTQFLMDSCEMSVPADAYVRRPDGGSTKLTMHVTVAAVRVGSRLRAFTSRCELALGGVPIGSTFITSSVVSPAAYMLLRRRARGGWPPPWSDQLCPCRDRAAPPRPWAAWSPPTCCWPRFVLMRMRPPHGCCCPSITWACSTTGWTTSRGPYSSRRPVSSAPRPVPSHPRR